MLQHPLLLGASPVQRHGWAYALVVVFVCTGLCALMTPYFDLANLIMVYLAGVVYAALRFGQSASVVAVLSSVFLFDLIFVPPRWSLNPTNTQHMFTVVVMLLVGLLISRLVAHARDQALVAEERAGREHALNELARQLAIARSPEAVAAGLEVAVRSTFGASCALLLPDPLGQLCDPAGFCLHPGRAVPGPETDVHSPLAQAQRALDRDPPSDNIGWEGAALADTLYLPLRGVSRSLGVLAIHCQPGRFHTPHQSDLLKAFANQAALALERSVFERKSADAAVEVETERLRSTLLSGISHDFRTPLTTIVGAATSLLRQDRLLDNDKRYALTQSILDEARRMHVLVSDLLDLTRMEEGGVQPVYEWCPADELIEEARKTVGDRLLTHQLQTRVGPDAVVWCDPRLLVQALSNLLDNAVRYTPAGSTIVVEVDVTADRWQLIVSDNGPGLPVGHERDVFKKFYRGRPEPAGAGTGLGLAICATVARLHQGSIEGVNHHGARITLCLPQPAHQGLPPDEVSG
jgi:two-component system sensor histidine kinase KdpD